MNKTLYKFGTKIYLFLLSIYRFDRQLAVDMDNCTNPDYHSPFSSKEDAVKRLIR